MLGSNNGNAYSMATRNVIETYSVDLQMLSLMGNK